MTIERLTPGSGLQAFPPADRWDDWREYDPQEWPRRVEKRYLLVPTICFNCEAACGLLAAPLTLFGLFVWEHLYVQAPQRIPLA